MKFSLLILFSIVSINTAHAQTINYAGGKIVVEFTKEKKSGKANIKTAIKSFSGLDSTWVKSLENKFNQSFRIERKAKKGQYLVSVRFIISKDGRVSEVLCENDPGYGLCGAVVREVRNAPRWRRVQ